MSRIFQAIMVTVVAVVLTTSGAAAKTQPKAAEQVYDCKMTTGRNNLIPDRILIIRNLATNEINVLDGVIYFIQKKPMQAKVKADTATRLDLAWTVQHYPLTRNQESTGIFSLTFLKGDLSVHENIVLAGYDNAENRSGTCALAK
jgi:hypothetical protein